MKFLTAKDVANNLRSNVLYLISADCSFLEKKLHHHLPLMSCSSAVPIVISVVLCPRKLRCLAVFSFDGLIIVAQECVRVCVCVAYSISSVAYYPARVGNVLGE